jgi:hypothetical protein
MTETLTTWRWRARIAALALGLVATTALAFATGFLSTPDKQVVAGVPLATRLVCSPQPDGSCISPGPMYYAVSPVQEPTFKGWGEVSLSRNYADRARCAQKIYPEPTNCRVTAWRWNATSRTWSRTSLLSGTRTYIWPFATGWSWVWTSNTGWLAVSDDYVVVRWEPMMVAT